MTTSCQRAFCWLLIVLLLGCSSRSEQAVEREASNLKPLAVLYGRYRSQHQGQPPANEEALRDFVTKANPKELESLGVKDASTLFVSSRDQKPYKFVFGGPSNADAVVVYEQDGVDGKRYIGTSLGKVEEVDEARFRELVPAP